MFNVVYTVTNRNARWVACTSRTDAEDLMESLRQSLGEQLEEIYIIDLDDV